MKDHNYFVYITTNSKKTVLYVGVTNDLEIRMLQHFENRGDNKTLQEDITATIWFTKKDIII